MAERLDWTVMIATANSLIDDHRHKPEDWGKDIAHVTECPKHRARTPRLFLIVEGLRMPIEAD